MTLLNADESFVSSNFVLDRSAMQEKLAIKFDRLNYPRYLRSWAVNRANEQHNLFHRDIFDAHSNVALKKIYAVQSYRAYYWS